MKAKIILICMLGFQITYSVMMPAFAAVPAVGPESGRRLFAGAEKFRNGGPACIACHNMANIGAFGGGALGPDLTNIYGQYGEDGISSILSDLPFPTMMPIYEKKPLTSDEQANLLAFFKIAENDTAVSMDQKFLIAIIGGSALSMFLINFLWRKRLVSICKTMVKMSTKREAT